MRQPGGAPHRLLRRQEIVGAGRLHLGDPLERVLDLVQVVGVPIGDEIAAFVEEGPGSHR